MGIDLEKFDKAFHEWRKAFGLSVMRELSKVGLYKGQPPVLFLLDRAEKGLTQAQLAEKLSVSPASITVSLRRMEKAGLVLRSPDHQDARRNLVTITEDGRLVLKEADKRIIKIETQMLSGFSTEEAERFLNFFERSIKNLKGNEESD